MVEAKQPPSLVLHRVVTNGTGMVATCSASKALEKDFGYAKAWSWLAACQYELGDFVRAKQGGVQHIFFPLPTNIYASNDRSQLNAKR